MVTLREILVSSWLEGNKLALYRDSGTLSTLTFLLVLRGSLDSLGAHDEVVEVGLDDGLVLEEHWLGGGGVQHLERRWG